jgi:hypothetical protein
VAGGWVLVCARMLAVGKFSPVSRKSVFFDGFRIWINYLPATLGDRKEQE